MPAVNGVGEPCAGEPHARIDGRGLETERGTRSRALGWDNRLGNRRQHEGPRPYTLAKQPRQSPTLLHHRWVRSRGIRGRRGYPFLARWPSDKAVQHARDRIRQLTMRSRLRLPVEEVVGDLNRFLRGWAGFFRYGHSTVRLDKIGNYARERLAGFIRKRHRRGRGFGWMVVNRLSANQGGLISLNGTVVAPRAFKPWREKPNAGGERRR